jgi:hypothetical protein
LLHSSKKVKRCEKEVLVLLLFAWQNRAKNTNILRNEESCDFLAILVASLCCDVKYTQYPFCFLLLLMRVKQPVIIIIIIIIMVCFRCKKAARCSEYDVDTQSISKEQRKDRASR